MCHMNMGSEEDVLKRIKLYGSIKRYIRKNKRKE
jgi:hypothetical protein